MVQQSTDDPWSSVKRAYGRARRLGVAKVALTGKVLDCNEAFGNILGQDRLATVGKNVITDLTWPQEQELTQKRFAQLAKGQTGVVSTQKQLRQHNGQPVDVFLEACLIVDDNHRPRYIIDAIWENELDQETDASIQKLEAMFSVLRKQMGQPISQPQINITGASMNTNSHNTAGGDITGRDKITNNTKAIRWIAGALVAMAAALTWGMYYLATIQNQATPEPPQTEAEPPSIQSEQIQGQNKGLTK